MRRRIGIFIAGLLAALLTTTTAFAQAGGVPPSPKDTVKPGNDSVHILSNDSYRFDQTDTAHPSQTLVGHVGLQQGKTRIYCDSLVMFPNQHYADCYGNVHINDNDSVQIYSDFMKYQMDTKMVFFQKNVKLTDGKGVLTTQDLSYDLNQHVGTYTNGGRIVNKESVLTSRRGMYFENTKDMHFYDNVVLRDPQYDLSADSLLYNTQTQISTFITETFIQFRDSTRRTVRTRSGFYDLRNHKAEFGKRPVMTEGSQRLTGDSVRVDDSLGVATAIGNASYVDTAQGIRLLANYMFNNKKKNTFFATQRPLMIIKQGDKDKDSLYITADTLESRRLVDFEADQKKLAHDDSLHHIYVDSLEKVAADSLHNLSIARGRRDSLAKASGDTTANMQVKDLSDSLAPGVADSLARIALDSLHRARGDSAYSPRHLPRIADSTGKKLITGADSARLNPPTPKELRKQQKAKERAERQARRDSISDAKERIRDMADSAKAQKKRYSDSLKIRQQDIADSIQAEKGRERARKRAVADSIRQVAVNDSLRLVARADSTRHANLIDSLDRVGLTDSANALRRKDSLKLAGKIRKPAPPVAEAPLPGHEADSISRIPAKDTSLRLVIGFHHVRIYSDSLQAVADSLYYSSKDSVFRLFYNPIAWGSGNYQITGDTMYVYTKNKKANRLYVFENALAINKVGRLFYNQLKGTTINAFFLGGEIDYIRAKGNAESIYYVTDEHKAYTGVNRAHADVIDMRFAPKYDSLGKPAGKELDRVVLRNDAEGTMYPFKHVVFEDMILRGFKWQEERRPKSKKELFEEIKRKDEDFDDEPATTTTSKH
jgi:lipopolysaccharide export system protein LptA